MVQYYAFPAPKKNLFQKVTLADLSKRDFIPFWECKCTATKFQEGMPLDEVRNKILNKWLSEIKKNSAFQCTAEDATKALKDSLHAYVVLEDTATMLLDLRRTCGAEWSKGIEPPENLAPSTIRKFSYLAMLTCVSAEGTFVGILTEGKQKWLDSENEKMSSAARLIGKDSLVYKRLD